MKSTIWKRPRARYSVKLLTKLIACVGAAAAALLPTLNATAGTFTVTTAADSGSGSLRQAILDANANPGADTIVFSIGGTGYAGPPLIELNGAQQCRRSDYHRREQHRTRAGDQRLYRHVCQRHPPANRRKKAIGSHQKGNRVASKLLTMLFGNS